MSTVTSMRVLPLHRYDVRGTSIAVSELGSGGAVALFVPGYTGSKEDFFAIADDVVTAGFRFVAMDQRGQYESADCADPAAYTIEALATDLSELIGQLGRPVHLVGHSFGGLVSRAAVIGEPSSVLSLTLMSTGPGSLSGPRAAAIRTLGPLLASSGIEALYDAVEASAAADPQRAPSTAQVQNFMRRRFVTSCATGLAVMGATLLDTDDRVDQLRTVGVPLLCLRGTTDDAWLPEDQADMARRLAARDVVIAGAAHSPAAEMPAETAAALVDFWRSIA